MLLRFLNTVLFRSFIVAFLVLVLFFWMAHFIGRHQLEIFDLHIIQAVQELHSSVMTMIMKGFTTLGSGIYVSVITLLLLATLAMLGHRKELFFFGGAIVGSSLLNVLLKQVFKRARPDVHRIIDAAGYSFPSGHSMAAFTLYGMAIYLLWKHLPYPWLRILVAVSGAFMVLMIGTSRIYLGVHYPSDVLGGYMISIAWLAISIGFYEGYLEKRWLAKKARNRG